VPGVAANENGAGLRHESRHGAGVAGNGQGAPLQGDARPQRRVALYEDAPAPGARAGALGRAAAHADGAAHEVLADGPSHKPVDLDVGPMTVLGAAQSAEEVAGVPLHSDGNVAGKADGEVVAAPWRPGRGTGPVGQRAQGSVHGSGAQIVAVQHHRAVECLCAVQRLHV